MRHVHILYLHLETTESEVTTYLSEKISSDEVTTTKIISKGTVYVFFKIAVPDSKFKEVLCPELWPSGCTFKEWKFR